jgi:hypothetical protein
MNQLTRVLYALAWAAAAWFPLTDADIWWHLASARAMLEQGSWLTSDPFTFTAEGLPWLNVHWLYQLAVWGVYRAGGLGGLVAAHALCWGTAAYLWNNEKRVDWLLLFIPLLWATHYLLMARPLALTIFLLGVQYRAYHAPWPGKVRWGLLIVIQIMLANSQGLFLLGPALLALYAWRERQGWRTSVRMAGILVLVSMVHPAGPRILLYPWKLLARLQPGNLFGAKVSENISPWQALLGLGEAMELWQALALLVLTILMVWLALRKRITLHVFVSYVPWLGLAWLAQRNIPILLVMAIPLVASKLPPAWGRDFRWWLGLGLSVAFAVAQCQWWIVAATPVAPFRTPTGAVQFLRQQLAGRPLPAPVFCEIRHGGYLAWKLYPMVRTYVDGRLILRATDFFQQYLALETQPGQFQHLPLYNKMDYAVLPVGYPGIFRPLAHDLAKRSDWRLVYFDEVAWVFARAAQGPLDLRRRGPERVRDSAYLEWQVRQAGRSPQVRAESAHWWREAASLLNSPYTP